MTKFWYYTKDGDEIDTVPPYVFEDEEFQKKWDSFALIDLDGDGKISSEERNFLKSLKKKM